MEAEWHFLMPHSILPDRMPIGTEDVIRTATREQFLDFYNTWYRPERMALVVVGQVDPAAVAPLVAAAFGDMKCLAPARPEPELGTIDMPQDVPPTSTATPNCRASP
jgi:zinc protease